MINKNNFFFGFSLAILVSFAGYGLLYVINDFILKELFGKAFLSPSLLGIVALGFNIFLLRYFLAKNYLQTGKGILAFVFIGAAFVIYYFFGAEFGFRKPRPGEDGPLF